MPELPEVETVMRGLEPVLVGRRIVSVELRRANLRFPFPADFAVRLAGKRVLGLTRRAKYIVGGIEGGDSLLMHLGMTGRFSIGAAGDGAPDHVVFHLDTGPSIVYSDPRRFGMMDVFAGDEHRLLKNLGVEPLGNELNAEMLAQAFHKKSAPLKAALLDQRIIAGLGNIYVCEALHRSGLSPRRKAGTLKAGDPRLDSLIRHIRDILSEAISAGGSTLQDFAHANGDSGYFQHRFSVYDREGEACKTCGRAIKRLVQGGRSTFYCGACQK